MTVRDAIKNKIKLLEVEATNQGADLYRAARTVMGLEQAVVFTREQLILLKAQLDRCSDG